MKGDKNLGNILFLFFGVSVFERKIKSQNVNSKITNQNSKSN